MTGKHVNTQFQLRKSLLLLNMVEILVLEANAIREKMRYRVVKKLLNRRFVGSKSKIKLGLQ